MILPSLVPRYLNWLGGNFVQNAPKLGKHWAGQEKSRARQVRARLGTGTAWITP